MAGGGIATATAATSDQSADTDGRSGEKSIPRGGSSGLHGVGATQSSPSDMLNLYNSIARNIEHNNSGRSIPGSRRNAPTCTTDGSECECERECERESASTDGSGLRGVGKCFRVHGEATHSVVCAEERRVARVNHRSDVV
jgi:hypothetical protein